MNNQPPRRRSPDNQDSELTDLLVGYHEYLIDQSQVSHPRSDPLSQDEGISLVSKDDARVETPIDLGVLTPPLADIPSSAPCPQDSSSVLNDDRIDELIELEGCLRLLENVRRASGLVPDAHTKVNDRGDAAGSTSSQGTVSAVSTSLEKIRIGRFEILREIGRGGLGLVFLAHDPVLRRKVALKVPRGDTFLAVDHTLRFRREAQAAARLTHPHIVPVYEIGEAGPFNYIASEYVTGVSLAKWLSSQTQPPAIQLAARIVADLAGAMHYAHGQGVLHRDLKPSNILVESHGEFRANAVAEHFEPPTQFRDDENVPVVKITDFGLAKLLDHSDEQTRPGAILGTPAYMSPEQAEGKQSQVGPATDIYALGVILYELLTREQPFRGNSDAATLLQVVRNQFISLAAARPNVAPDIQAICLKCLEPTPSDRYVSAGELADDLNRFLRGEPTLARPLTQSRRLARWASKNRSTAALLTLTALSLVTVSIGSVLAAIRIGETARAEKLARDEATQFARVTVVERNKATAALEAAKKAETEADRSRATAEREADKANQVSNFMHELFLTADPLGFASLGFRDAEEVGMDLSLEQLLERGANQARSSLSDQPLVLATMLDSLGNVYCNLAQIKEAEPLIRDAYKLRQDNNASDKEIAASQLSMGNLLRWQGDYAQSEQLLRQALAARERIFGPDSLEAADVMFALVFMIWQRGLMVGDGMRYLNEAASHIERCYAIRVDKLGPEHRDVAIAASLFALTCYNAGNAEQANRLLLEAVSIQEELEGGGGTISVMTDLLQGAVLRRSGDLASAIEVYRRQIPILTKMCGAKHPFVLIGKAELAGTLRDTGKFVEAFALGREVIQGAGETAFSHSPIMLPALYEVAEFAASIGECYEAERYLKQAAEINRLTYGSTKDRYDALVLARLYLYAGRYEEAGKLVHDNRVGIAEQGNHLLVEEINAGRATGEDLVASTQVDAELAHCRGDTAAALNLTHLTCCYGAGGGPGANAGYNHMHIPHAIFDTDEGSAALPYYLGFNGEFDEKNPSGCATIVLLARYRIHQKRIDEASVVIQQVKAFLSTHGLADAWYAGYAESVHGEVLAAQGRLAEAEPKLLGGLAVLRKSRGDKHWLTRTAATSVVKFYKANNREADAVPFEGLLEPLKLNW